MKNVMAFASSSGGIGEKGEKYIRAQIDNSLDVGWKTSDIVLAANFEFEYKSVRTIVLPYRRGCNGYCHKMFFLLDLYKYGMIRKEQAWLHDLDAWQTRPMPFPQFADIGFCTYTAAEQVNSGSLFFKPSAVDIVEEIATELMVRRPKSDEPITDKILKEKGPRATRLNQRYNVGSKNFSKRCSDSEPPIMVAHFHPGKERCWNKFCAREDVVPPRLKSILEKHFK